jgi:hypothetical protein
MGDTISKINYIFEKVDEFITQKTSFHNIHNFKIVVEKNGLGVTFLNYLSKKYGNKVIGINTTESTKTKGLDQLRSLIYNSELRINNSCSNLIGKIIMYPYNKNDDILMALLHYLQIYSPKETTNSYKFLP